MSKKICLTLALAALCVAGRAQYQFPNSDFEGDFISSYGSYTEPEGWHGYASIDASTTNSFGRSGSKLCASDDVRDGATGSRSVYVCSTSILGVIANGVLTNGQIYTHSTTATDGTQNYNFSDPTNSGSSTYGDNNQFFTTFTGRPDYMKVWVKFVPASEGTGNARVSVYTHKKNTVMYDPTDNVTDESIIVAHAEASVETNDGEWQQLTLPFEYSSTSAPGLILATFTTNETPGGGSAGDYLYIDDIEMVYNSELTSLSYDGQSIDLTAGTATVDAVYSPSLLLYATNGAGARVVTDYPTEENNYTLTITVNGDNISDDPTNTHSYAIQFSGAEEQSSYDGDDEADVVVTTPELTSSTLANGTYYIYSVSKGGYLNISNGLDSEPTYAWTVNTSSGSVQNATTGNYLTMDRTALSSSFSSSNFPITTDGSTSWNSDMKFTFNEGDGYIEMFRQKLKYYSSLSTRYSNFFVGVDDNAALCTYWTGQGNTGSSYYSYASYASVDYTKWQLFTPAQMMQQAFCPAAGTATTEEDYVVYDITDVVAADEYEASGLPLGLYAIDGGDIFYLADGEDLVIPQGSQTVTYYGRLDFSITITYDGEDVTHLGATEATSYDEDKLELAIAGTGNGIEDADIVYDQNTSVLTITVYGYGRARTYTVAFGQTVEHDIVTYTDQLSVTVNGYTTQQTATVSVERYADGTIDFTLQNFTLEDEDLSIPVGNIAISNLSLTDEGEWQSFSYQGDIVIKDGDDPDVEAWLGPALGSVPLDMQGYMTDEMLYVTIDIDMQDVLGQTIEVVFGEDFTDPAYGCPLLNQTAVYLYNAATDRFLSYKSSSTSSHTPYVDLCGVPVNITNNDDYSRVTIETITGLYMAGGWWAELGSEGTTYEVNVVDEGVFQFIGGGYGTEMYISMSDTYRLANNGVYGDNFDDYALTYWQVLTAQERDAIVSRRADEQTSIRVDDYFESDVTDQASTPAMTDSKMSGWDYTTAFTYSGQSTKANSYGAEVYEWTGSISQTISGLTNGWYRVTMQAFQRFGTFAFCNQYEDYSLGMATLSANDASVPVCAWVKYRTDTSDPDGMEAASAHFDEGEYTNTVWAEVTDGTLTISVNIPAFTSGNWVMMRNLTVTAYTAQDVALHADPDNDGTYYATYSCADDRRMVADEVVPYVLTSISGNEFVFDAVEAEDGYYPLAANTGYLMVGTAATASLLRGSDIAAPATNLLTAAVDGLTLGTDWRNYYALAYNSPDVVIGTCGGEDVSGQGVAFYNLGEGGTINAGTAYVQVGSSEAKGYSIVLDGCATAIAGVQSTTSGVAYDLAGRRTDAQRARGIYIINGKKILK